MSSESKPKPLWLLICHGGLLIGLCSAIAYLSPRFAFETEQAGRPLLLVLALFGTSFFVYLSSIYFGLQVNSPRVTSVVIGFAIACRMVLLFSVPIQEIDIYRYIWDGHVVLEGVSPYAHSPDQVLNANPFEQSGDLARLVCLRDESEAKRLILERIHYGQVPTVYPPVSQAVFALAAATTPRLASLDTHVVIMKSWIVLFDLATMLLVFATLRFVQVHPAWFVGYAWCPLVLKEFANSGHLDSIAVSFCAAAVYCVLRAAFASKTTSSRNQTGLLVVGGLLLALAVGAKLYPVVIVPLFAATVWKRLGWRRVVVASVVFSMATVVCLWPLRGGKDATPDVVDVQRVTDPQAGLKVFLSQWMMNDFIFLNLAENTIPDRLRGAETAKPWFVFVPNELRESVTAATCHLYGVAEEQAAFSFARTVTASVFVLLAVVFALSAAATDSAAKWLERVFLSFAWFWLLLPTLNPWYWIWAMPWVVFARNRVWMVMSGLLFVYYLRFHFGAHYAGERIIEALPYQAETFFDFVVVWFEYVPWFVSLTVVGLLRRPRES